MTSLFLFLQTARNLVTLTCLAGSIVGQASSLAIFNVAYTSWVSNGPRPSRPWSQLSPLNQLPTLN